MFYLHMLHFYLYMFVTFMSHVCYICYTLHGLPYFYRLLYSYFTFLSFLHALPHCISRLHHVHIFILFYICITCILLCRDTRKLQHSWSLMRQFVVTFVACLQSTRNATKNVTGMQKHVKMKKMRHPYAGSATMNCEMQNLHANSAKNVSPPCWGPPGPLAWVGPPCLELPGAQALGPRAPLA